MYHDTQLKPTGNHPEYQRRVISGAAAKKFIKKKTRRKHSDRLLLFCHSFSGRVWEYLMPTSVPGHGVGTVGGCCFLSHVIWCAAGGVLCKVEQDGGKTITHLKG